MARTIDRAVIIALMTLGAIVAATVANPIGGIGGGLGFGGQGGGFGFGPIGFARGFNTGPIGFSTGPIGFGFGR